MKTQIKIEDCGTPFCTIHTPCETQGIKDIADKISRMDETGRNTVICGWDADYCIQVKQSDIFRIYSADKKVYMEALTGCGMKGSNGASGFGAGALGSGKFGSGKSGFGAGTSGASGADAPNDDGTETLLVKMRLYEFEELAAKCGWTDFIRISNTDIVNFSKVTKLDMSLSGIIKVKFTNGKDTIVSRRYMNKIKDQLNMVRRKNNENN